MRSPHSRALALTVAVVVSIAIALPASAGAITTESTQITTPSGIVYEYAQQGAKLAIAGTATDVSTPDVEIRCYYGAEAKKYRTVAEAKVEGGAFAVEADAAELPDAVCQLRAVPQRKSAEKPLPPGEPEPFEGPIVITSEFFPEDSNYYAASSTLTGTVFLGGYALESYLYSAAGHDDAQLFYGVGNLSAYPPLGTRASLQIDGTNAYLPKGAREVEEDFKKIAEKKGEGATFTPPAAKPKVTVEDQFDASTRQITVAEEDPVVTCSPGAATYPPTPTSCTSFVATGVTLKRTWQTSDEDHVTSLSEAWTSTDGAAHTVNARYLDEMASAKGGGAYEFPGEAAFGATERGEAKTLSAGPAAILYATTQPLSEIGDGEDPQGAIVYDTAPSEPLSITEGSAGGIANSFEAPYALTVPAGGSSARLQMTFIQSFALTEVSSLAAAAIAGYEPSIMPGAAPVSAPGGAIVPATTPAPATASVLSRASATAGHVTFALACHGGAGTSCKVRVNATTVERIRHGRVTAVVASTSRAKQVTIAAETTVIPAGHALRIALKLNATGHELLARFGELPAHVTATLEAAGTRHTLIAQNLTIKQKPRRR
jgi:hypothetical protein